MFKNLKIVTFFTNDGDVNIDEFRKDVQNNGGDLLGGVRPKQDKTNSVIGLVCYFLSK